MSITEETTFATSSITLFANSDSSHNNISSISSSISSISISNKDNNTYSYNDDSRSSILSDVSRSEHAAYVPMMTTNLVNWPTATVSDNSDIFSTAILNSNYMQTRIHYNDITSNFSQTFFQPSDSSSLILFDKIFTNTYSFNNNTTVNISENTSSTESVARSLSAIIFIIIITTALSVFTAGTNLLVIIAFRIHRRLQTISNYFLVSLSVADFIIGFVSMPLYTIYLVCNRWPFGPIVCDIWLSIDYTVSNASVANLLLICLDRYLSITFPLSYRARRSGRLVIGMIVLAWTVSFVLWVPWIVAWPLIQGDRIVPDSECYIQFFDRKYGNQYITVFTAVLAFYLPITIMSVLYWLIYVRTRRRRDDVKKLQALKFDIALTSKQEQHVQQQQQQHHQQMELNSNDGTTTKCYDKTTVFPSGQSELKSTGAGDTSIVTFSPTISDFSTAMMTKRTVTITTALSSALSSGNESDRQEILQSPSTDVNCASLSVEVDVFQRAIQPVSKENGEKVRNGNGATASYPTDTHTTDKAVDENTRCLMEIPRRSAPDILTCTTVDSDKDTGRTLKSKSHDDLRSNYPPALMRWPSVVEKRTAGTEDGAALVREDIMPISARDYIYNIEMDDISASMMTFTQTGEFDDSSSENIRSSSGTNKHFIYRQAISCQRADVRPARQTLFSLLRAKFRGGSTATNTEEGGSSSQKNALFIRRQKRRHDKGKESKAAKTLSAILAVFLITWLPYNLFIVYQVAFKTDVSPTLFAIGEFVCIVAHYELFCLFDVNKKNHYIN